MMTTLYDYVVLIKALLMIYFLAYIILWGCVASHDHLLVGFGWDCL